MISFTREKYNALLTAYANHLKSIADPVREIVNILAKYWALPKGTEEYIRHTMEDKNLFRPIVVVCVHDHYIGKGQNIVIDSCGESSRIVIKKIMPELEKSIRKFQTTLLEEEKLRQIQQKTIAATKKKLHSVNNQLADLNRQLAKKQEQLLEIKHRIEILEKQRDALMTDEEEN